MIRLLLLLIVSCSVQASFRENLRGYATVEYGYQFQGVDQSHGETMLHLGVDYALADNLSVGVWVGEYNLPEDQGDSTEVDYFISYRKSFGVSHTFHTSIWRYTFQDSDLDTYDWTQWLISYNWNDRLGLTVGLSDNYLNWEHTTTFAEASYRYDLGNVRTSISLGRQILSRIGLESFNYVQLKGTYNWKRWHVFADYTKPEDDGSFTDAFAADGWGFGVSYTF